MRISNMLMCGLLAAGPAAADDLRISGGTTRLTGTVRSINEQGAVELDSPLSPTPLVLKAGIVDQVEFSAATAQEPQPPSLVQLANGDRLPATIESLDDRKLTVVSPHLGRLEIPRESLRMLQLGIRQGQSVYSGPTKLAEWIEGSADAKNWEFQDRSLVANGPATASRRINFPENFILRFRLEWESRTNPNFEVTFADPMLEKGKAADRYLLRFNSAGFQIKREAARGQHYADVISLARLPNQFPDRSLDIEIRVNRKTSKLEVFLNGEPDGEAVDPLEGTPSGTGLMFICNQQNGQRQEISAIGVTELEDSSIRHRSEERGDPKQDSLISREDERWGGSLLEIRGNRENPLFRLKSEFQNDPLEIPASDVSTVFFAARKDGAPKPPDCAYLLRLKDKGELSVSTCRFDAENVTATHPLLGPVTIKRSGVTSLQRTDAKNPPEP